ncbi:MAG TPA: M48 family metalloprotease [Oscillatoriaceae cyanobacterium]
MGRFFRALLTTSLLLAAADTLGCGRALQGAVAAAPALLPISDAQEIQIGAQAAQQVLQQTPALANASVQAYVDAVGQKVAAHSDRTNIPYHFTVIASTDLNAFSLPGGYVFITKPLLALMSNEAQLADVLGHEVGHIAAKHSVAQIREAAIAQGIETAAIGNDSGVTKAIADAVITLVERGYGRADELQADQLGALYGSRAGYDPNQLWQFLTALSNVTGESPPWLYPLETHPPAAERVSDLKQYITDQHLGGVTLDASAFLQATAALR